MEGRHLSKNFRDIKSLDTPQGKSKILINNRERSPVMKWRDGICPKTLETSRALTHRKVI